MKFHHELVKTIIKEHTTPSQVYKDAKYNQPTHKTQNT